MSKSNDGTPAAPPAPPKPEQSEEDLDVVRLPEICLVCEQPLLNPARPFIAARFAKFTPEPGAESMAEILETPAGESGDVAICLRCAMTSLYVVSQNACAAAQFAREAAASGKKA